MKLYLSGGGSGRQNLFAYNSYFNSIDKSKPILYVPLAMEEKITMVATNGLKVKLEILV